MSDYSLELKQIKENLSPVRDTEIRRKAGLMIGIMEARSVRLGCRLYGVSGQTHFERNSRNAELIFMVCIGTLPCSAKSLFYWQSRHKHWQSQHK